MIEETNKMPTMENTTKVRAQGNWKSRLRPFAVGLALALGFGLTVQGVADYQMEKELERAKVNYPLIKQFQEWSWNESADLKSEDLADLFIAARNDPLMLELVLQATRQNGDVERQDQALRDFFRSAPDYQLYYGLRNAKEIFAPSSDQQSDGPIPTKLSSNERAAMGECMVRLHASPEWAGLDHLPDPFHPSYDLRAPVSLIAALLHDRGYLQSKCADLKA